MSGNRTHTYGSKDTGTSCRVLRRALGTLIAVLILGAAWAPPCASGAEPATDPAGHFARGEFDRAYAGYFELFLEDPGDPDINFSLGRAAFETGDFEAAIMAFERVLLARPAATRTKLEIARCYFHLGSLETAARYFDEVMAEDPPPKVRANIEQYREAIRASKREHFLTGSVSLGVDFDDNVNTAPSSSSIELTDLLGNIYPLTMDDAQADQVGTATLGLNYLYKPLDGPLSWKLSCLGYSALYRDAEDLDVGLLDARAGFCLERGRSAWDVYGLATCLNLDDDRYLNTLGGGTSLSFVLSPRVMLSADARYRRKDYRELDDRDAHNLSLTLSPAFVLGAGSITLSAGWEHEAAEENVNTYTRLNGIVGCQFTLPFAMGAHLSYWYQGTDYDEVYPLFGRERSDDVQYFTAGISRTLYRHASSGAGVSLGIAHTYTRSDSSIDLYSYTKNVTSTSITFVF